MCVCITSEPKPSSTQSSEPAQSKNTEIPPLRSFMDFKRHELFFLGFKFLKKLRHSLSLLRVLMKKLTLSLQLNCLKTSFAALLMERQFYLTFF